LPFTNVQFDFMPVGTRDSGWG